MSANIYNEYEISTMENAAYHGGTWVADYDPEMTDGTLAVRRFGSNLSLLSVHDEDGTKSVLLYNGNAVSHWDADEDEIPAPAQAIQELMDRNSEFYREYIRCRLPYSAAKREAEEIYSLVAGEVC